MKNYLLLIFAFTWLISCSGKEETSSSNNLLENLSFSVDTVLVDAGDDFLNLSQGIFPNGLSPDRSKLYFFENSPVQLVEIDLENLKLVKKTKFETEGPNGVGSYLSGLKIGPDQTLLVKSNNHVGLFDRNAQLLKNLRISPTGIDSTLADNYFALYSNSEFDFDSQKIYSYPSFRDASDNILLIIDTQTKTARSLPVPKMKIVDEYSGTYTFESEQGTAISFFSVRSSVSLLPKDLILSTAALSGFYKLNLETETLEFVDIQHQIAAPEIQVVIPQDFSGPEEVRQLQNQILEQVNYQEILWDESRQLYFRLGEKTFRGESYEEPITYEYYLFVYDKDFKVVGESKLEGIDFKLKNLFFKDGKLWSYVNVEDELGFAVLTFDF
ncbi:DUF4221 family protein [Algoriphagus vanfongensis]|uniref:DUF4221 family protein n=1 Tax=Algoriphagus vanfongensis TaxID=426371 RepID=UPI00041BC884|nr:DUF4221 family protein [Algoriphagus vanfongensis]